MPEAQPQRPVTIQPPSTCSASPSGAIEPHVTGQRESTSAKIRSTALSGRREASQADSCAPIRAHQPAEESWAVMSAMTWVWSRGCALTPPSSTGEQRPKASTLRRAASVAGESRRNSSLFADSARRVSPMAAIRSRHSARWSANVLLIDPLAPLAASRVRAALRSPAEPRGPVDAGPGGRRRCLRA